MYVTATVHDRIILNCSDEGLSAEESLKSIKDALENNLVDKVIPNEGLCSAIDIIKKVEPMPIMGPNDGRSCYRISAKILMFKPLPREVLFATIKSSDALGLRLTMGFFHDIRIPTHALPSTAEYEENLGLWKWTVDGDKQKNDLYYELGSLCRFQVVDVVYAKPGANDSVPMLVVGSMVNSGMGPDAWWS